MPSFLGVYFKKNKTKLFSFGLLWIVAAAGVFLFYHSVRRVSSPAQRLASAAEPSTISLIPPAFSQSPSPIPEPDGLSPRAPSADLAVKLFSTAAVPGLLPPFSFSGYIPAAWRAKAVQGGRQLGFIPNALAGDTNVSYVRAEYVKTSSVFAARTPVLSRVETSFAGYPAVDYQIGKKSDSANIPREFPWVAGPHRAVIIRVADRSPNAYIVFSKNPVLADGVFEAFLQSLNFTPKNLLFYPTEYFPAEVTKKPFGIFVSPTSSPVFPEKFTGFHTAADVDIPDSVPATASIPVIAISDGIVVQSQHSKGYGGVVAIRHEFRGESFFGIYSYLNPKTLIPIGTHINAGQIVGNLGKGLTKETDGERRHLSFGIYIGDSPVITGYVPKQAALAAWADPVRFFAERMP